MMTTNTSSLPPDPTAAPAGATNSKAVRNPAGRRWSECDAYLFDIDGTLLNTRDLVHYYAFHHAVRELFNVNSHIDGVPVHGNTDIGILRAVLRREGLADSDFEARLPEAVEQMCEEVSRNAAKIRPELCPSIRELLEKLQAAGKLLGIVSGNFERIGWLKLEAAGVRDFFSFGQFSNNNELRVNIFRAAVAEVRHRLGQQASSCIIGDTPSDIQAAQQLGIPVIAVATGVYALDKLQAYQPDLGIACCTGLLAEFS